MLDAMVVQEGRPDAVEALVRETEGQVEMLGDEVPLGVREGTAERDSDEQALAERVDAAVREALGEALAVLAREIVFEADTVEVQEESKESVPTVEYEVEVLGDVRGEGLPLGGREKSAEKESEGEALPERVGATEREALGDTLAVTTMEAVAYSEEVRVSEGGADEVQALVREREEEIEVRGEIEPLGVGEERAVEEGLGDVVSVGCTVAEAGMLGVARALPLAGGAADALAVPPPAGLAEAGEDALVLASAERSGVQLEKRVVSVDCTVAEVG